MTTTKSDTITAMQIFLGIVISLIVFGGIAAYRVLTVFDNVGKYYCTGHQGVATSSEPNAEIICNDGVHLKIKVERIHDPFQTQAQPQPH